MRSNLRLCADTFGRRVLRLLLACALAAFMAACGSDDGDGGTGGSGGGGGDSPGVVQPPPTGPSQEPLSTAKGTPMGGPTTASIGAGGGTLTTPDGRIRLTVPAGALSVLTTLSIQPISNHAPGRIGNGYRLLPEAASFAQPVSITFTYGDGDVTGSSPDALGIATQTAAGQWQKQSGAVIDKTAKTVTVSTTHFSDWSLVQGLQLRPPSAVVKVGNSVGMKLLYCFAAPNGAAYEMGYDCDGELAPLASPANCAVNGTVGGNTTIGRISQSGQDITYTAPSIRPSPAGVAVSCEINGAGPGKILAVSNITVTDADYSGGFSSDSMVEGHRTEMVSTNLTWTRMAQVPGDQAQYTAQGTALVTVTEPGCPAVSAELPVTGMLIVFDSNYLGPDPSWSRKYAFWVNTTEVRTIGKACRRNDLVYDIDVYGAASFLGCGNYDEGELGAPADLASYSDVKQLVGTRRLSCDIGSTSILWDFRQ
ncbi:MAG: hypothetical protein J0H09_26295 [Burkholderiales bacterium]|nr:hypothetical protein [Burkholderiales bacterium]